MPAPVPTDRVPTAAVADAQSAHAATAAAPDLALDAAVHALALKQGVALGGLAPDPRDLVLGLAWAALSQALPAPAASERQVNDALRAWLAGAGALLRTDHVELRRWLVDGGWLQRDGYGRAYVCVPGTQQPEGRQQLLRWLVAGPDRCAQVLAWRAAHAEGRALRRQAWMQQPAGA